MTSIARTKGIGERFKIARLALGYSLGDISNILCIQAKYLRALESNQLFSIKEVFYREQYVKSYATFLGFEWETIRNDVQFLEQQSEDQKHLSLLNPLSHHIMRKWEVRTVVRGIALALIAVGCLSYFVIASSHTFSPPELALDTPLDQLTTTQEKLIVSGKTQKDAALVMINGARVPKDERGNFKQEIVLTSGLNTIHVTAAKRFSPSKTVTRQVFRKLEDRSLTYLNENVYGKTR